MAIRSPAGESHHNRLVASLANHLVRQGWTQVRADGIGWSGGAPVAVAGYEPDVSATDHTGYRWIFEVETCETISIAHTRSQWSAFDRANSLFAVMTPASCSQAAVEQARFWGISVDRWWVE